MVNFLARRLAQAVFVIWGAVTLIFIAVRVLPGDPSSLMLGTQATQEEVDSLRRSLGFDRSLPEQYVEYLRQALHLDFGQSWRQGGDALAICLSRLPATAQLAVAALVITLVVGFPLGVVAARYANRWPDHLVASGSLLSQGAPPFWIGIMLSLVFSRIFNVLPSSGADSPQSLILPAATLALPFLAWLARLVRTGVLEEMNQDYVTTARSKGISERVIFYVHILRNVGVAVVTVLGLLLGNFIANAVIVEIVFAWPGIGRLLVDSITYRDYSVVVAALAIITTVYVALNLLVDILYFYVDPRIRSEKV